MPNFPDIQPSFLSIRVPDYRPNKIQFDDGSEQVVNNQFWGVGLELAFTYNMLSDGEVEQLLSFYRSVLGTSKSFSLGGSGLIAQAEIYPSLEDTAYPTTTFRSPNSGSYDWTAVVNVGDQIRVLSTGELTTVTAVAPTTVTVNPAITIPPGGTQMVVTREIYSGIAYANPNELDILTQKLVGVVGSGDNYISLGIQILDAVIRRYDNSETEASDIPLEWKFSQIIKVEAQRITISTPMMYNTSNVGANTRITRPFNSIYTGYLPADRTVNSEPTTLIRTAQNMVSAGVLTGDFIYNGITTNAARITTVEPNALEFDVPIEFPKSGRNFFIYRTQSIQRLVAEAPAGTLYTNKVNNGGTPPNINYVGADVRKNDILINTTNGDLSDIKEVKYTELTLYKNINISTRGNPVKIYRDFEPITIAAFPFSGTFSTNASYNDPDLYNLILLGVKPEYVIVTNDGQSAVINDMSAGELFFAPELNLSTEGTPIKIYNYGFLTARNPIGVIRQLASFGIKGNLFDMRWKFKDAFSIDPIVATNEQGYYKTTIELSHVYE